MVAPTKGPSTTKGTVTGLQPISKGQPTPGPLRPIPRGSRPTKGVKGMSKGGDHSLQNLAKKRLRMLNG